MRQWVPEFGVAPPPSSPVRRPRRRSRSRGKPRDRKLLSNCSPCPVWRGVVRSSTLLRGGAGAASVRGRTATPSLHLDSDSSATVPWRRPQSARLTHPTRTCNGSPSGHVLFKIGTTRAGRRPSVRFDPSRVDGGSGRDMGDADCRKSACQRSDDARLFSHAQADLPAPDAEA